MPRSPRIRPRIQAALYWLLPSLICLWLHRDGLHAWFQADDFAWLGANTEYNSWNTFRQVLFRPAAQGTLRPWSERLFFFAFWHAFGWNALAYRAFVLLNQCANLVLATYLVRRISGSGLAGLLAPLLWIANSALIVPMAWTSGYNEILCATFLLLALALWIEFAATGRRLFYVLQFAVFLLGFGALELNIVFPAIAAAYSFSYSRRTLLWTLPLFACSIAYYRVHAALVPLQTSGPYQPHFDLLIVQTLGTYWKLAFIPPFGFIQMHPALAIAMLILGSAAAAAIVLAERPARFFACWFLITLAPLLTFRDHITHYYLAIPMLGLAAVLSLAASRAKWAAAPVLALYFAIQIPTLLEGERWYLDRSRQARNLVMGVKQIHEWEPAKTILLTDVSRDLYGFTIADSPFRLIRDTRVYLAPEAEQQISGLAPNLASVSMFTLPAGPVRQALLQEQLAVYSAAAFPLREETAEYTVQTLAAPAPAVPRRIDPGSPFMAYLLGPEWHPIEGAYRWMPKRATFRIGGPAAASQQLFVQGYSVPENLPAQLSVFAEGRLLGSTALTAHDAEFTRSFPLPANFLARPSLTISLEVDRTFRPDPRGRELGLVFGSFEIR